MGEEELAFILNAAESFFGADRCPSRYSSHFHSPSFIGPSSPSRSAAPPDSEGPHPAFRLSPLLSPVMHCEGSRTRGAGGMSGSDSRVCDWELTRAALPLGGAVAPRVGVTILAST